MNRSGLHLPLAILLFLVSACVSTTGSKDLARFLSRDSRKILTFVGYSGAGYEDEAALLRAVGKILAEHDPREVIVNCGVTPDGIGDAVYRSARERGFTTIGIVSLLAKDYPASPFVEHPFYIADDTWGGLDAETGKLSPTSARIVDSSDIMVGIGGGKIARDELRAARSMGKQVTFIPADMNHRTAIEKARKKGLPEPTDFAGEARTAF